MYVCALVLESLREANVKPFCRTSTFKKEAILGLVRARITVKQGLFVVLIQGNRTCIVFTSGGCVLLSLDRKCVSCMCL